VPVWGNGWDGAGCVDAAISVCFGFCAGLRQKHWRQSFGFSRHERRLGTRVPVCRGLVEEVEGIVGSVDPASHDLLSFQVCQLSVRIFPTTKISTVTAFRAAKRLAPSQGSSGGEWHIAV
jgi:hypothetical protein